MKKFMTVIFFALLFSVSVYAADEVAVIVNGEPLDADAEAEIIDGRTFVPLRAIAEALGAEVEWKQESRGITLRTENAETALAIGSLSASITKGNKVSAAALETAPYIKDDKTYVPLRFIAQGLNCKVYWLEELNAAVITDAHSRADGNLAVLLEKYLTIDLPTAIKADSAKLAADIESKPESVINYFSSLWTDRALELLADEMTEKQKEEFSSLASDSDKQYAFLTETGESLGIPVECPITMTALTNNATSAIIIDAPTVRTAAVFPQCAFLSSDGGVISVTME